MLRIQTYTKMCEKSSLLSIDLTDILVSFKTKMHIHVGKNDLCFKSVPYIGHAVKLSRLSRPFASQLIIKPTFNHFVACWMAIENARTIEHIETGLGRRVGREDL